MALPAKIDLPVIWRGCTWLPTVFHWKDADGQTINTGMWTPFVETRDFSLNPVKISTGVVSLSLTKEATASLKLGLYSWDWIWQSNDGSRLPPLIGGKVEVKEPTTTP